MKNKIVTHFYVKEAKKDSKEIAPIYLRITVNGERAEVATNKKVDSELWDKSSERVSGRSEPARMINGHLENLLAKVNKHFSNADIKDERISVWHISSALKGKNDNQITLVKAFDYHISCLKKLANIDIADTTVKKYEYTLNSLRRFLKKVMDTDDTVTDVRIVLQYAIKSNASGIIVCHNHPSRN